MKCANCNKVLNDEIIAFCEKCEEIYCMSCCKGHGHGLSFMRYKNNELFTIPIGITGMGVFDTHHKFYLEPESILNRTKCPHAEDKMDDGQPIFECEDGKIMCGDCFYKSGMETIQPFLKVGDDELIWLLPSTFDPFDLNFTLECDNYGKKGQSINANIKIENKKKNPIKEVEISIGAVAADPCPLDISYESYLDDMYPYYLFVKNLQFNSIGSNEILTVELKLNIPADEEIEVNQFAEFYIEDGQDNTYCKNGFLYVPEKLMVYTCFSYKTLSDHIFMSYIETDVVNIK